jgi:TfoX/Sxy family transcriptional regulator of competence genes
MAYDEKLAQRVRERLAGQPGLAEKKMFGGVAFMLRGNMCCGVLNADLIVRVGPKQFADALERPHARPFDVTGRPMRGIVMVGGAGLTTDEALRDWIERGTRYALSLPAK